MSDNYDQDQSTQATRDIADVAAVEIITTAAVHLMSASAVKVGLADDPDTQIDLDEARKLITALAGLGNVYVNELCFLRGVLPTRPITAVTDVEGLVALAHRLITANRDRSERTTTGNLRRGARTFVYGRERQPCRRCGTRIRSGELGRSELEKRVTYWCPRCQT